jgi:AraC-like DNA-binding protein
LYKEFLPAGKLRHFVECFWQSQSFASIVQPNEYRVLPDGCVDLIFDLTPGYEHAYWVGTMTTSLCVRDSAPKWLLGIRFRPGGASSILRCPAWQIKDQRISIGELTPSVFQTLEKLAQHRNRVSYLEEWLSPQLAQAPSSRLVAEIHTRLDGTKKVSRLAEEMGFSRQYLNRVMKAEVGVDLKTFSRILRMRRLTDMLRGSRQRPAWSDLAVSFGFYDQSHLIHEFTDLVGLRPGEFIRG